MPDLLLWSMSSLKRVSGDRADGHPFGHYLLERALPGSWFPNSDNKLEDAPELCDL